MNLPAHLRLSLVLLAHVAVAATQPRRALPQGIAGDPTRMQTAKPTLIDVHALAPRWSSDGRRILYTKDPRPRAERQIWLLELPSMSKRLLLRDGYGGTWSPEGRRIAYVRAVNTGRLVELDGRLAVFDLSTAKSVDLGSFTRSAYYRLKWVQDTIFWLGEEGLGSRNPVVRAMDLATLTATTVADLGGTADELARNGQAIERIRDFNAASPTFVAGISIYPTRHLRLDEHPSGLMPGRYEGLAQSLGQQTVMAVGIEGELPTGSWDGLWIAGKDTALASLVIPQAYQAEMAPDWSRVAFVRGDSLYVAPIATTLHAPVLRWQMPIGATNGLVVGDLVTIYAPRTNPLNHQVLGYLPTVLKARGLVYRVSPDSAYLQLHEVAVPVTASDIGVASISTLTSRGDILLPTLWAPLSPDRDYGAVAAVKRLYRVLDPRQSALALACVQDARHAPSPWNWEQVFSPAGPHPCGASRDAQEEAGVRLRQPAARVDVIARLRDLGSPNRRGRGVPGPGSVLIPLWAVAQMGDTTARDLVRSVCANWEGQEQSNPRETQFCLEVLQILGGGSPAEGREAVAATGSGPVVRKEAPDAPKLESGGQPSSGEPAARSIAGTWEGPFDEKKPSLDDLAPPLSGPLTLVLTQEGTRVSGTSALTFTSRGGPVTMEKGTVSGRFAGDSVVGQVVFSVPQCSIVIAFVAQVRNSSMSGAAKVRNDCGIEVVRSEGSLKLKKR